MKERLIPLLGAALAFYVVFVLLFPNTRIFDTDSKISLPTTEDKNKYGLYAARQWLQVSNISTLSLRDRYDDLISQAILPEQGNLLIVSLPLRIDANKNELNQLSTWLKSGNNAVFLVAMSDWPDWAKRSTSSTIEEYLNLLGLELFEKIEDEVTEDTSDEAATQEPDTTVEPSDILRQIDPERTEKQLVRATDHPLTRNIKQLAVWRQETEGDDWQLRGDNQLRSTLPLFIDKETSSPAIWLTFSGKAKVLVTSHADLFSNRALEKSDNAKLFRNIVNYMLAPAGGVIFDDMHQGLRDIYDADAFYKDPRLHATLFFLLALWLTYVLGYTNRFSTAQEKLSRLKLSEHVTAIGDLLARRLHSSAIAQRLAHHFFNEVRSYYGQPMNGEPVWDKLENNPAIEKKLLARTEKLYQHAVSHEKINLNKFNNYLNTLRRELQ
jgi:hypothetical protein